MIKIEINKIYQIITTLLSLVLTTVLPIFGFLQIGVDVTLYIPNLKSIISMILLIGSLATATRYFIYQYPQFSKKRALFSLFNSTLLLIYLGLFSLLSKFQSGLQPTSISINLQGIFILLTLPWIMFLIRDIYNLVDFSFYGENYVNLTRRLKFERKNFVICSRCGYKAKIILEHCPRCHSPL